MIFLRCVEKLRPGRFFGRCVQHRRRRLRERVPPTRVKRRETTTDASFCVDVTRHEHRDTRMRITVRRPSSARRTLRIDFLFFFFFFIPYSELVSINADSSTAALN